MITSPGAGLKMLRLTDLELLIVVDCLAYQETAPTDLTDCWTKQERAAHTRALAKARKARR